MMAPTRARAVRSEEHTSELQSHVNLVCRLLLETKKVIPVIDGTRWHVRGQAISAPERWSLPQLRRFSVWAMSSTSGRRSDRCFFFNDTATTEIYTLSLHDALPI